MNQIRILLLAAGQREGERLALDLEVREIESRLAASRHRDAISLVAKWAVRPGDLMQALDEHDPHIVHVSGHGTRAGQLLLLDDDGDARPVGVDALGRVFRAMRGRTRVVIFNACFSRTQAQAVIEHVDCAIGMSAALSAQSAIVFAAELYRAIGCGRSIGRAFEQALASISVHGLAEEDVPELLLRRDARGEAVDPYQIFLLQDETSRPRDRAEADRERHDVLGPTLSGRAGAWQRWLTARRRLRLRIALACTILGVLAGAACALWWPPLSVPRLEQGAGIVVAGRRFAGGGDREAHEHLVSELRALGEQYVQPVDLPMLGVDDRELVHAAEEAGASLAAVVDPGPRLRLLPIPGKHGTTLLERVPALAIARHENRRALAPMLIALAWSAEHDPATLPSSIEIAVPDPAAVGPSITVLAMYLHELTGRDRARLHRADPHLRKLVAQCAGTRPPRDWTCSLAFYLHYGISCPGCPGALQWLTEVTSDGPEPIGDAALLEILQRHCVSNPEQVAIVLERLERTWGPRECRRLAAAVPASCLLIEHEHEAGWLSALAHPPMEALAHCGDLRPRVLAQRAYMYGSAGKWASAAADYMSAAMLSPDQPEYLLDWAAALLQVTPAPADLVDRIASQIEPERMDANAGIWASFLLWLASDDPVHAEHICRKYMDRPDRGAAVPPLGPLAQKICAEADGAACRVYRILRDEVAGSAAELCQVLGTAPGNQ